MIGDKLKNFDIGMLFLNAGYLKNGAFADLPLNEIEQQVAVNTVQPIYCCKVLVDQMSKRNKRTACVFVSSIASLHPFPGLLTYCATKTFVNFMGQGLNFELKDKNVDVMSWQPGEIETKMLHVF